MTFALWTALWSDIVGRMQASCARLMAVDACSVQGLLRLALAQHIQATGCRNDPNHGRSHDPPHRREHPMPGLTMTDPIPTMSETGTTWTRAKFLAEIADLPQLAKYVPAWGPMPGVPIADVVAMLREARGGAAQAYDHAREMAESYGSNYKPHSDGFNTFRMLADYFEQMAAKECRHSEATTSRCPQPPMPLSMADEDAEDE